MNFNKISKIKLLISFLLVFISFQFLVLILKEVSLSRHPLDELVYKLKHSQERGAIILLGDSVTYDVAKRYQIGKKNQIVNFTTNKASGLIGSYFLLQRYFSKSGKKVNDVIFISTPEFLNFIPKNATAKIYLNTVFENFEEINYLKELNIYAEENFSLSSLINVQTKIIEPLIGLTKNRKKTIFINGINPRNFRNLESIDGNEIGDVEIKNRVQNNLYLSTRSKNVLNKICDLSKDKNFRLHIVTAPIPKSVYLKWKNSSQLLNLKKSIFNIEKGNCKIVKFFDMNQKTIYPDYAFRDIDHLKSPGWSSKYAREIETFIGKLN